MTELKEVNFRNTFLNDFESLRINFKVTLGTYGKTLVLFKTEVT